MEAWLFILELLVLVNFLGLMALLAFLFMALLDVLFTSKPATFFVLVLLGEGEYRDERVMGRVFFLMLTSILSLLFVLLGALGPFIPHIASFFVSL